MDWDNSLKNNETDRGPEPVAAIAVDGEGRRIDYLRISITDRCNERCLYCMPHGLPVLKAREELLSYEEILRVVRLAVGLGFRKFRVTGGEPMVRRGAVQFLLQLAAIPGVESLGLSTNGTLLAPVAGDLRRGGLDALNISVDTLDPVAYRSLTRGELADCLAGIEAAIRAGIPSVKLNAVLLKGLSEEQILPLIRFAQTSRLPLRFIEWMPVSGDEMRDKYLSAEEVRRWIEKEMSLDPVPVRFGHGPARYYRTAEGGLIGFISAMSDEHFCDDCNKIRLTADGKIRPCLGDSSEFDLRGLLRSSADDAEIARFIRKVLSVKPRAHSFSTAPNSIHAPAILSQPGPNPSGSLPRRPMSAIGG